MTLTAETLSTAMQPTSVTTARLAQLLPAVNQCLLECDCTTVPRAAMWYAQVGTESGGLQWMEELADGSDYNGRTDLGNTQPGDGPRFKGRGPIQVTGRDNYTRLSAWAFGKGLVPTPTYFVDNPDELASDRYGFIGVTWYWTTQRPMNDAADARDIVRATQYVNGGQRGIDDRTARWNHCLALGPSILPDQNGIPAMPDYGITDIVHGYNPTTGPDCTGNSNGPRAQTSYVVLHTQQAHADAISLANFCNGTWNTGNPVSYNGAVDDTRTVEIVPVIEGPWAAMDANDIAVHLCFAGSFAEWTTAQWESTDASDGLNEDAMLTRGAKYVAAACQQFGIPVVYAGDSGKSGWPILPKGIVGHRDFGARGGGHTDPGDGFPMDEFLRRVQSFMPGQPPLPPPSSPGMPQPVRVGPADDQLTMRFNCLGGQTLVEAVAEIRDHVLGTNDRHTDGVVTQ